MGRPRPARGRPGRRPLTHRGRWPTRVLPRRKLQVDAADVREALNDARAERVSRHGVAGDHLAENLADLRRAMTRRGPPSLLRLLVDVSDGDARHAPIVAADHRYCNQCNHRVVFRTTRGRPHRAQSTGGSLAPDRFGAWPAGGQRASARAAPSRHQQPRAPSSSTTSSASR